MKKVLVLVAVIVVACFFATSCTCLTRGANWFNTSKKEIYVTPGYEEYYPTDPEEYYPSDPEEYTYDNTNSVSLYDKLTEGIISSKESFFNEENVTGEQTSQNTLDPFEFSICQGEYIGEYLPVSFEKISDFPAAYFEDEADSIYLSVADSLHDSELSLSTAAFNTNGDILYGDYIYGYNSFEAAESVLSIITDMLENEFGPYHALDQADPFIQEQLIYYENEFNNARVFDIENGVLILNSYEDESGNYLNITIMFPQNSAEYSEIDLAQATDGLSD